LATKRNLLFAAQHKAFDSEAEKALNELETAAVSCPSISFAPESTGRADAANYQCCGASPASGAALSCARRRGGTVMPNRLRESAYGVPTRKTNLRRFS